jgi:hypothetical protein
MCYTSVQEGGHAVYEHIERGGAGGAGYKKRVLARVELRAHFSAVVGVTSISPKPYNH